MEIITLVTSKSPPKESTDGRYNGIKIQQISLFDNNLKIMLELHNKDLISAQNKKETLK